jgi:hypothetical protein
MENWIPYINDVVTTTLAGHSGRFIVIRVDVGSKTADLESVPLSRSTYILASVTWDEIRLLAEAQPTSPATCERTLKRERKLSSPRCRGSHSFLTR